MSRPASLVKKGVFLKVDLKFENMLNFFLQGF